MACLGVRFLFIIIFSFFSVCSFAQIEKKLNIVLQKKDFRELKKFINSYRLEKNNTTIQLGNFRDLTNGFQESIFYISKYYPFNGISITSNPRIKVITQGNQIIYYELKSEEMKNFPKSIGMTSDTTYKYSNLYELQTLNTEFKKAFLAPLIENELFVDTIYYGKGCGHNGTTTPKEQSQMSNWVLATDTANIYKWLQSTNTEKQVYAVQGFYFLHLKGYFVSDNAQAIIKRIMAKKGTINTCMTCDSKNENIQSVLKSFQF